MDTLSPTERSERMSRIRSKNTRPERLVCSIARRLGHKYRTHRNDLPGSPDLVFRSANCVVFVHGCFWHRHAAKKCPLARRVPKSRSAFWSHKLAANRRRDARNSRSLRKLGWNVLVVWECELRNQASIETKLHAFLK
jgi:DNA mismatch endonuclease, patch repair protein